MIALQLNQTLLIDPSVSFDAIEKALQKLGWTRENQDVSQPLIPGEPEFANWTWQGAKPFIIYTFNPVVRMRVLDVATLPPMMRAAIASRLSLLDERGVEQLFVSKDARKRLLGLLAAQETERVDLLQQAIQLIHDPEPVVAEQAREVVDRLRRINEARHEVLAGLHLLTETAPQLIRNLAHRSFVHELKPQETDLTGLFDNLLLPVLKQAVEAIYSQKLRISNLETDATIQVFAAPAGLFRWPNMLSEKFPQGYRDIAGWMNPRRVWLCWTITTPSGGKVRYDGLAWIDGRWVWLPKIFRYLTPYLLEKPDSFTHRH